MTAFVINDDEWGVLLDEPADVLKVYCAIRRVLDFRSGVAGLVRRISEQMLREVLGVASVAGRHTPAPVTRQKVRSVLTRLERLGLLRVLGPLVFKLPLADADRASKTGATKEQPDEKPGRNPPEATDYADYSELMQEQDQGCLASSNPPPISDIYNNHTAHNARVREAATPEPSEPDLPGSNEPDMHSLGTEPADPVQPAQRFPMCDDWKPDPKSFKAVLARNGIPNISYHPDQLMEFRSYWICRPERCHSQGQWEHSLAQQLKRTQVQANAGAWTPYDAKPRARHPSPVGHSTGTQLRIRAGAGGKRGLAATISDDNW